MFYLITYDIEEDKKRNKIAKLLEDYGTRVQYSVFECAIDYNQLEEIKKKAEDIIDKKKDSVRIYRICEGCLKEISILGSGEITKDLDFYII